MEGLHVVLDAADHRVTSYLSGSVATHSVCNNIEAHVVVTIKGVFVIVSLPTDIGEASGEYSHRNLTNTIYVPSDLLTDQSGSIGHGA
jgi:hypothetical protein